jgi:hypothetical protein
LRVAEEYGHRQIPSLIEGGGPIKARITSYKVT